MDHPQPLLFSLPTPPRNRFRLFLGLFPDAGALEHLGGLIQTMRARHQFRGNARPPHILHVTLELIGDYPDHPETPAENIRAALSAAELGAPFDVVFDRTLSFQNRQKNPFVLLGTRENNAPLWELRRQLLQPLLKRGFRVKAPDAFAPHVTLFYDSRLLPEESVAPIRWTAREVVLVLSHLGETRYDRLDSWRLGDSNSNRDGVLTNSAAAR